MPRPRFERADPEKREALLEAAAHEFAEQGYDAASTNRILAAAGFSKGAFYYYFDDKEDLAIAVLEREAGKYLKHVEELPPITSADEFWPALARSAQASMAQMRESQRHGDALTRLGTAIARKPEMLGRCGPALAATRARLAAFWKQGQQVGAVRDDLPLGTLLAMLEGIKLAVTNILLPADRAATGEELAEFARVYFDLVRRVTERAPAAPASAARAKAKKPEDRR